MRQARKTTHRSEKAKEGRPGEAKGMKRLGFIPR
jgi:hypothetical protein